MIFFFLVWANLNLGYSNTACVLIFYLDRASYKYKILLFSLKVNVRYLNSGVFLSILFRLNYTKGTGSFFANSHLICIVDYLVNWIILLISVVQVDWLCCIFISNHILTHWVASFILIETFYYFSSDTSWRWPWARVLSLPQASVCRILHIYRCSSIHWT